MTGFVLKLRIWWWWWWIKWDGLYDFKCILLIIDKSVCVTFPATPGLLIFWLWYQYFIHNQFRTSHQKLNYVRPDKANPVWWQNLKYNITTKLKYRSTRDQWPSVAEFCLIQTTSPQLSSLWRQYHSCLFCPFLLLCLLLSQSLQLLINQSLNLLL